MPSGTHRTARVVKSRRMCVPIRGGTLADVAQQLGLLPCELPLPGFMDTPADVIASRVGILEGSAVSFIDLERLSRLEEDCVGKQGREAWKGGGILFQPPAEYGTSLIPAHFTSASTVAPGGSKPLSGRARSMGD